MGAVVYEVLITEDEELKGGRDIREGGWRGRKRREGKGKKGGG